MCLAIYKPAGSTIAESHLQGGWQSNPGGAGFAYLKKGKVEVVKGLMKYQEFLAAYNEAVKKNKKSQFLVHFRIPSMGDHSPSNTHPFRFKHGALIHNGTMYGTGAVHGAGKSDTAYFAEKYGDKLTFANVEEHKKEINEALGYNKVAILYDDGRHQLLNEEDGLWLNNVWYSNKFFLPAAERMAMK